MITACLSVCNVLPQNCILARRSSLGIAGFGLVLQISMRMWKFISHKQLWQTVSCTEIFSSSKSNQLHFPDPGVPPIKILRWLGQTDGVFVAFRQMLLNSKIDECFHIYKWSFSGGPTTINFPISKWTFFQGMYSPFRTEIKDPGLDSSQNINYGSIWKAFETAKHFFSFASLHTFCCIYNVRILGRRKHNMNPRDGVGSPILHQIPQPAIGQQWSVVASMPRSHWSRASTFRLLIGAASGLLVRTDHPPLTIGQQWPAGWSDLPARNFPQPPPTITTTTTDINLSI